VNVFREVFEAWRNLT